ITISLCLHQIIVSPSSLPALRYWKFIQGSIGVGMEYFFFCDSSEVVDNCHGWIRKAVAESRWDRCSNRTKKDLCVFIRRVQQPNYLKFHNGAIVLSRIFFLKVCKVAYTFSNFPKGPLV
ncbi:hypothetical protein WDU94_011070, partial [Cyamophila willieti]